MILYYNIMPIKNLPKAGSGFRPRVFAKKLSNLTRSGSFKNLRDNSKDINAAVAGYASVIKRGGLSRKQQLTVIRKAKAGDSAFSKIDVRQTKKILKHLSPGRVSLEKTDLGSKSKPKVSALEDKRASERVIADKRKRNVISSRRSNDFLKSVKGGPGEKSSDELKYDSMASASALNPGTSSIPKPPPSKPGSGSFSNLY